MKRPLDSNTEIEEADKDEKESVESEESKESEESEESDESDESEESEELEDEVEESDKSEEIEDTFRDTNYLNESGDYFTDEVLHDLSKGFITHGVTESDNLVQRVNQDFRFDNWSKFYAKQPIPDKCHDFHAPLFDGSKVSKGEWAISFLNICEEYLIPKEFEDALLNNIYNAFGSIANVPAKLTEKGKINSIKHRKNLLSHVDKSNTTNEDNISSDEDDDSIILDEENAKSALQNYTSKVTRYISFDTCIDNCTVFTGNRLQNKFFCPSDDCKKPRFRPCSRAECKFKGSTTCEHLLKDGIAYKTLYYRLLIPLLLDLVDTNFFVQALNYQNDCILENDDSFYQDWRDGSVPRQHLANMKANFESWKAKDPIARAYVEAVYILLSEFYDGGQLFSWAVCNFWGLFTGILNLPPSYRGKIGISVFLSAIYGGHSGRAEDFLFIDCYCEELRVLYEGYEHESKSSGKRYFIQARLILHTLDSRAQESLFKIMSMSNSREGCWLCRMVTGVHDSSKCLTIGNRQTLPITSVLRYYGQSGKCCPTDFYSRTKGGQWWVDETFISNSEPISAASLTEKLKGNKLNQMGFCKPCDNNTVRESEIIEFLLDKDAVFTWAHDNNENNEFDFFTAFDKLRDHIYYRHFDFRPYQPYERITKEMHMKAAREAERLNAERNSKRLKKKLKKGFLVKKKKDSIKVDCFEGVWPFARLPYTDLPNNVTPPIDHAIGGVVNRMCSYMFGSYKEKPLEKKKKKKRTKKQSRVTKLSKNAPNTDTDTGNATVSATDFLPQYRPSYANIGTAEVPYRCSNPILEFCNASLQCVLIPVGANTRQSSFKINLNQMGFVKLDGYKKLVTVYWNFIISILDIQEQYKVLFRMMGFFLTRILALKIPKNSVATLQEQINEILCLWEAILPLKENFFQLHQLMDLVSSIPLFGTIPTELNGEQALGAIKNIKKKSNPGGVSYEGMIARRHIDKELRILERFYATPVNNSKNINSPNHRSKVLFNSTQNILYHRQYCFEISKTEKLKKGVEHESLTEYEINSLISTIIIEIHKLFKMDIQLCEENSCLYRIVKTNLGGKIPENIMEKSCWNRFLFIATNSNIFSEEELKISRNCINFSPVFHSKALIYGLPFRSRGSQFRRSSKLHQPREEIKWSDKRNFSCWCMFQQSIYGNKSALKYRYGRINCFFQINVGDPVSDNIIVASITAFQLQRIECNLDRVSGNEDSALKSPLFVSLQDISPTLIATIPYSQKRIRTSFDGKKDLLPVLLSNRDSGLKFSEISQVISYSADIKINHYIMLILNPERMCMFPLHRPYTLLKHHDDFTDNDFDGIVNEDDHNEYQNDHCFDSEHETKVLTSDEPVKSTFLACNYNIRSEFLEPLSLRFQSSSLDSFSSLFSIKAVKQNRKYLPQTIAAQQLLSKINASSSCSIKAVKQNRNSLPQTIAAKQLSSNNLRQNATELLEPPILYGYSNCKKLRLSFSPHSSEEYGIIIQELRTFLNPSVTDIEKYLQSNTEYQCLQLSKPHNTVTINERKLNTNSYGLCGIEIIYQFYKRRKISPYNTSKVRRLNYFSTSQRNSFLQFLSDLSRYCSTNHDATLSLNKMIEWIDTNYPDTLYNDNNQLPVNFVPPMLPRKYWWDDNWYNILPSQINHNKIVFVYFGSLATKTSEWLTVQNFSNSSRNLRFTYSDIKEMTEVQCYFQYSESHFFQMDESTSADEEKRLQEALTDLSIKILNYLNSLILS